MEIGLSACQRSIHRGVTSSSSSSTFNFNPNPSNFKITRAERVNSFIVAEVRYPDCTNYEGKKILVFENITLSELFQQNNLDPHFCDSCKVSPIARFEPTHRGWLWAINFCNVLKEEG